MSGEYLQALYSYETEPSEQYSDAQLTKLTDCLSADPMDYTDINWVGVLGSTKISIQIQDSATVDWIAVHVLSNPDVGIALPIGLNISVIQGNIVSNIGYWETSVTRETSDNEYVLGNTSPLGFSSQSDFLLVVELPNDQWTFISELEITADS